MPAILHIETSTSVCSIAISQNGASIFNLRDDQGQNHAKLLAMFIQEALNFLYNPALTLDAVAVSAGPGSYTGLRIGVSTAKGLCYGFGIPLLAVSTLETMAIAASGEIDKKEDCLLCPMIDARRMEVYTAFFNRGIEFIRPISADIIESDSYADLLNEKPVYFFGDGAEKCKQALTHPNAHFINNITPLAQNMITPAEKAFNEHRYEDVAYFEPFYLKEFQTTSPKKNSL